MEQQVQANICIEKTSDYQIKESYLGKLFSTFVNFIKSNIDCTGYNKIEELLQILGMKISFNGDLDNIKGKIPIIIKGVTLEHFSVPKQKNTKILFEDSVIDTIDYAEPLVPTYIAFIDQIIVSPLDFSLEQQIQVIIHLITQQFDTIQLPVKPTPEPQKDSKKIKVFIPPTIKNDIIIPLSTSIKSIQLANTRMRRIQVSGIKSIHTTAQQTPGILNFTQFPLLMEIVLRDISCTGMIFGRGQEVIEICNSELTKLKFVDFTNCSRKRSYLQNCDIDEAFMNSTKVQFDDSVIKVMNLCKSAQMDKLTDFIQEYSPICRFLLSYKKKTQQRVAYKLFKGRQASEGGRPYECLYSIGYAFILLVKCDHIHQKIIDLLGE